MAAEIHRHLKQYAHRIRDLLRASADAPETAIAPLFQDLVHTLLPLLDGVPQLTVSPEYARPGVGRPDIALVRAGQPARAFIELKAPAKPADPERWRLAHDRRQYERLKELAHWATSNFADFHLFGWADEVGRAAIVPERALRPDTPDRLADDLIDRHQPDDFVALLATLARADAPAARDAKQLAEFMAHSARLVRSAVLERLAELRAEGRDGDALALVRNTFKDVLYAHPEAGGYAARDFDELFASAFAQTLAFGLLLVREATARPVGDHAWRDMPDEHPLMKAALRVLSEDEVTSQIGIGFDVMRDTVNSFSPEILAIGPDGRDPILYFYEDFLAIFDPQARERYGVYYTPLEVVRYMAGALDRALRENLGTRGLRDAGVTILDPATGTGTFLLGVAERVRDQLLAEEGGPAASSALRALAGRMFAFELLVGPYAVAHYRLHHALRYRPADEDEAEPQPVSLPRLGVYLADTLAEPGAMTSVGQLGIQGIPIDEERREANRIKTEQPILAIIGNPPYKRLEEGENETLVGRWMDGLWDDLKKPVRNAGQGNQLNTFPEFSVAFWRWAMWKLFEAENAPNRGVIAFITNRKFLTGWPYAGLRKLMRERFDRIEVIDLRGDVRAGTRGDVARDEGVFNIMVGTAITLAIADGSKAPGSLAQVRYADSWKQARFSRRAKQDWLTAHAASGRQPEAVIVDRPALEDWRPRPFENGDWLSLREAFQFSKSGMKSGNDTVFIALNDSALRRNVSDAIKDRVDPDFKPELVRRLAYRPLDRRLLYNDLPLLDRPGPVMQAAWGENNIGLYTMASGVGAGPALWCHGLLPDYHAFRGSYGGYAFPLHDRRRGPEAHNLNPALLAALAEAYGAVQAPQAVFDAMVCLLSATSYARRFAEDLEDTFPHVPFPADPQVFAQAARIGAEIRALETFARDADAAFRPRAFCRLAIDADGSRALADIDWREGSLSLWKDAGHRVTAFAGLPAEVWDFAVSGYRVLPRWLEARKGMVFDNGLKDEIRDLAARIHELIHWFGQADLALSATLADTLTREELGFPANPDKQAEPDGD